MTLQEILQNCLNEKYKSGLTDEELAQIAGCTRVHINRLRHGKFPIEKVKLETLLRLFPDMRITLGGTDITASNSAVNTGTNNGSMTVTVASSGDVEDIKRRILDALADSDMCDECIGKAHRIIRRIQI